jgi:glycerate 2-kinase
MSRNDALQIYMAAVSAVQPAAFMRRFVQSDSHGLKCGDVTIPWNEIQNLYVAGAGKAAASMAVEIENLIQDRISAGVIITKYDHSLPLRVIECFEAGHPVPDKNGLKAANRLINLLKQASENDMVILLISGGASALLTDLPQEISLPSMQELNQYLIQSGATIHEINTVRKHLSLIKGGQLLRHLNHARVVALIMSDVPGDDLSIIASGLTSPDSSTFQDAWDILEKYSLVNKVSNEITEWLLDGLSGKIPEGPKPGDEVFQRTNNYLVATNRMALEAARLKAEELGYASFIADDQLQGEAREKALFFAGYLLRYKGNRPACILMGGETTVTVRGNGRGGRNQEFALSALCKFMDYPETFPIILAAGTDGSDGPTEATGAFADKDVIAKMRKNHLKPEEYLDNNDAYTFFQQTDGLIITGPTQTNVMDIVVGLCK